MQLLIVAADQARGKAIEESCQAAIPNARCQIAPSGGDLWSLATRQGVDLLIHDQLEGLEGILDAEFPLAVIVTGEDPCMEARMHALRRGAFDYLAYSQLTPELLGRVAHYATESAEQRRCIVGLKERNAYLKSHDPLTGLRNRSQFFIDLVDLAEESQVREEHLGLLLINLDAFRAVNDSMGQQAGDTVLKVMARRIQRVLRDEDALYRVDGNQFAVLVTQPADDAGIALVAERTHSALTKPLNVYTQDVQAAASIGGAIWPEHAETIDALVTAADAAMRAARSDGGGFRMADASMVPPQLNALQDNSLTRH